MITIKIWIGCLAVAVLFPAFGQEILIELTEDQERNLHISQNDSSIMIGTSDVLLNSTFKELNIKKFSKAFPSAALFDNKLSKRLLRVYVIEAADQSKAFNKLLRSNRLRDCAWIDDSNSVLNLPNDYDLPHVGNLPSWMHHSSDHLNQVNAPLAWAFSHGNDINIAIIEPTNGSGFDLNHPDLSNKIVYSENTHNNDAHGTAVAGVAGADTNNGIGVSSIGYNAGLMLYLGSIPQTFDYLLQASFSGARIANLSYRSTCTFNQNEQDIIDIVT